MPCYAIPFHYHITKPNTVEKRRSAPRRPAEKDEQKPKCMGKRKGRQRANAVQTTEQTDNFQHIASHPVASHRIIWTCRFPRSPPLVCSLTNRHPTFL
jgi:hypothetical protein